MVISEMLKLWVLYDILPDAKSFYSTMKKADLGKLKIEHLIFLSYQKIRKPSLVHKPWNFIICPIKCAV